MKRGRGRRDHGLFFLQGSFNELSCSGGVFFRDGWSLIGIIDGQIRLPLDYFDLWLNEISREIVRIERGGIYIINCWRLQKRYFAFKIWNNFNNPPPFLPFLREKRDNKLDENYNNLKFFEWTVNQYAPSCMNINNFPSTYFSSPSSKSLYSRFPFIGQPPVFVCFPLNEREIAVQNKSSSTPPLRPAFVIYLSIAHCSPEKRRESGSKRENKVKVNPLVSIVPPLQLVIITEK